MYHTDPLAYVTTACIGFTGGLMAGHIIHAYEPENSQSKFLAWATPPCMAGIHFLQQPGLEYFGVPEATQLSAINAIAFGTGIATYRIGAQIHRIITRRPTTPPAWERLQPYTPIPKLTIQGLSNRFCAISYETLNTDPNNGDAVVVFNHTKTIASLFSYSGLSNWVQSNKTNPTAGANNEAMTFRDFKYCVFRYEEPDLA